MKKLLIAAVLAAVSCNALADAGSCAKKAAIKTVKVMDQGNQLTPAMKTDVIQKLESMYKRVYAKGEDARGMETGRPSRREIYNISLGIITDGGLASTSAEVKAKLADIMADMYFNGLDGK